MPSVSVIIPCYNYARFLPAAVESVCAQTFRGFEIIIVDDGSPDDTAGVAMRMIEKHGDVEIRLIRQENKGLPGARNSGIAASAGEYFLPLDADDILKPEYLEKVVAALDGCPSAAVAYSWTEYFGERTGVEPQGGFTLRNMLLRAGPSSAALIRKSAWERVGGYNPAMKGFEEWEFYLSLFEAGYGGVVVTEPLFMYRRHEGSMVDRTNRDPVAIFRDLKLLHPRLFEPALSRLSLGLARAVIRLKYYTRDRVARHIYVNYPGLHNRLREMKYTLTHGR
ncbi:MAG: glycosyltransferase family 2 protein [Nitrospirae bacterium]|nr:glycosyltransferase family 2 protein [Nitrospirota bacterium]